MIQGVQHRLFRLQAAAALAVQQRQRMGDVGGLQRVLAKVFRPGGPHQAPAVDVLHPPQQGVKGVQHGSSSSAKRKSTVSLVFCYSTMGQGGWQAGAAGKVFAGTPASSGAETAKMQEKLKLIHNL